MIPVLLQRPVRTVDEPWLTRGNAKIGPSTMKFSLPAGAPEQGGTCPGATSFCAKVCYAKKGRFMIPANLDRRARNLARLESPGGLERFAEEVPDELRTHAASICRIHDSGDFHSVAYVEAWRAVVEQASDVKFWAYTRSYRVQRLRLALEKLRALPNMQLFASRDPTDSTKPPKGWRVATIIERATRETQGSTRAAPGGIVCPYQTGAQPSCAACRYCIEEPRNPNVVNVGFLQH